MPFFLDDTVATTEPTHHVFVLDDAPRGLAAIHILMPGMNLLLWPEDGPTYTYALSDVLRSLKAFFTLL